MRIVAQISIVMSMVGILAASWTRDQPLLVTRSFIAIVMWSMVLFLTEKVAK